MSLISLHRICSGISDEAGDEAKKYLARFIRYANLATKDLIIHVVPWWNDLVITSQILPVGSNFFVNLPDDYLYYVKVGICSGGRIRLLGVNDDMCSIDTNNQNCPCTEESTTEINNICCGTGDAAFDYPFYNTWRNGGYLGEIYGASGGRCFPGYFKEDKANNRLILSSELVGNEVIVEYKADPTLNGIALVPSECELAIRAFVHWRDEINKRPSVAQMHREEYITEYNRLKKYYSSITVDEWRNVFLKSTTSTVKR